MSGSSGVAVTSRIVERECGNCDWAGEIDLVIDPEVMYAGWECPRCMTSHEDSDEVFDDDGDPDYAYETARDDALFDDWRDRQ